MTAQAPVIFPHPLESYADAPGAGLVQLLTARIQAEPFNLVATLIFALAIGHTFMAGKIRHWSHRVEERHQARLARAGRAGGSGEGGRPGEVSFLAQMLHFFGEIEAIFGIWAVALGVAMVAFKGVDTAVHYLGSTVSYTEPMFVVVVMAMAATRPVVALAERTMSAVASLGQGSPAAWWLSTLIVAPILGSFITEPAAMTIAALLLAKHFYELKPSPRLKYATIGLLFVNISVGGTFTHFAAPPVLMVAATWKWDLMYMVQHFGWKAGVGIVAATTLYFFIFRGEFATMKPAEKSTADEAEERVPRWITLTHLVFLGFAVWAAHYPALFIGAFLFFLAFTQATAHHQTEVNLAPPMLVGFFLAGLVVHGGLQGWWISPVLQSLNEPSLFLGATVLTAFNDNAAITYLATLVPSFSEALKYAVVAGAVTGGGLTVIANAPNPAGQAILSKFFPDGVSPVGLLLGALAPTLVMAACFWWL
ncbi:MAG: putative Na+/H+ antiporter [Verrucomicrobia bacterium]|nr:MAG: putative Na+/H+ antiporter [Verrucomicrobiota bacterium]